MRLSAPRSISSRPYWLLGLVILAAPLAVPYLGASLHAGPGIPATAPGATAGAAGLRAAAHPAVLLGDLVVTAANSPYLLQGGGKNGSTTVVQGNVTVQTGGTLELRNITLVQEQFIGETGTLAQRLSHLYTITDQGTMTLVHSSIVSYTAPLNPFPKLALNVSNGGQLLLNDSSLAFGGTIDVYGAGTNLTLTNGSSIVPNPAAAGMRTNETISNDSRYAATLWAGGGAHVGLFDSIYNGTYADNTSFTGTPGPTPPIVDPSDHALTNAAGGTWSNFALQTTDSENLTRAVLYRAISGGALSIAYTAGAPANSTNDAINFGGALAFGPVAFEAGSGVAQVPLAANAVGAINRQGFAAFLGALGAGGGGSVTLGKLDAAATVTVTSITLNVSPAWNYNLTFTGAGTTLTAVDSAIDLNWNLTPGTPVDMNTLPPTPWGSNKLLLQDGAIGYFANVSIPVAPSRASGNQSAILPDATSSAVLYRWFDAAVVGAANATVAGASAT